MEYWHPAMSRCSQQFKGQIHKAQKESRDKHPEGKLPSLYCCRQRTDAHALFFGNLQFRWVSPSLQLSSVEFAHYGKNSCLQILRGHLATAEWELPETAWSYVRVSPVLALPTASTASGAVEASLGATAHSSSGSYSHFGSSLEKLHQPTVLSSTAGIMSY